MARTNKTKPIEVRPANGPAGGWEVARQGDLTPMWSYRTQREAAMAGRRLAQRDHDEFVLKGRNGLIRARSRG